MKSLLKISVLFIFLLCLYCNQLFANHAFGGTMGYTHLLGNQYQIDVTFFRDCLGDAAPLTVTVYITSIQCGITDSVVLNPFIGTGQEVTHPCMDQQTTCVGGTAPGIQKWQYKSLYTFSGQCADWLMYASFATRSDSITTIQNPSGSNLYIEARLNNTTGDNNTPQNSVDVFFPLCIDQQIVINSGMIDADGDSLVYELIPARIDANTNVTYIGSYSAQQPITSSPAASLDPNTGDLVLAPTTIEMGILVYRVLEYRNGILIGSRMLETTIYTIPCNNDLPEFFIPNWLNNYSLVVLPGPFCFQIYTYDSDTSDVLTMSYMGYIPDATFYVAGSPHPQGTFCWEPDSSDVRPQPYMVNIKVTDNNCPSPGIQIYSFSITVTFDSSAATVFPNETFYSGNVFFDLNQDGVKDSSEIDLTGRMIKVTPDSVTLLTGSSGNYFYYTSGNGTQMLSIHPELHWHITTDSLFYTIPDDSLNHTGLDFGLAPDSNYISLSVHAGSGVPRCNQPVNYILSFYNDGTTVLDGRTFFIPDPNTTYLSSIPAPDLISGDTLIYYFQNLWPSQSHQAVIQLNLPGAGTQLDHHAVVEMDSAGNFYELDSYLLHQTVACSFDPNDKAVSPEGLYSDHRVLSTDPLLYTIRFQNTGNDTAFTVFVQDQIDPSLDIQSLHVIGSSHAMSTTIFPDRMVEFRFNNILLPDSNADEPGSNGFIQYEITPLQNLSLPVVVENEASIYFDSNAPVLTNTVWNTLVSDLTVGETSMMINEEHLIVIPNPFHQQAEIQLGNKFAAIESQFQIFDAMGNMVDSRKVNTSSIQISKGDLQPGIYFFELWNVFGRRATGKFIID